MSNLAARFVAVCVFAGLLAGCDNLRRDVQPPRVESSTAAAFPRWQLIHGGALLPTAGPVYYDPDGLPIAPTSPLYLLDTATGRIWREQRNLESGQTWWKEMPVQNVHPQVSTTGRLSKEQVSTKTGKRRTVYSDDGGLTWTETPTTATAPVLHERWERDPKTGKLRRVE